METPDLLTAQQVAELVGRSRSQVNRDAAGKSPKLPAAFVLPGDKGARLFDRATVERVYAVATS